MSWLLLGNGNDPVGDGQLAADFTSRVSRGVDVDVGRPRAHSGKEFIEFPGIESLGSRPRGCRDVRADVCRPNRSGDHGRRGRTGLRSRRPVTQVRTQEHGDSAVHANVADVDVRLLHGALEIGVGELPFDLGTIADARGELPVPRRRYGWHFFVPGEQLPDVDEALCERDRGHQRERRHTEHDCLRLH